jgi:hypothetical protein
MRDLADTTPMLALAAAGWIELAAPPRPLRLGPGGPLHLRMAGLRFWSIGVSVLLGVTGYSDHFTHRNGTTGPTGGP